jgi:polysaccharide biosynthesis protein PslG
MGTVALRTTLLTLALVGALAVAPSAQAGPPETFFGVTPQTKLNRADFRQMSRTGVGTLRYGVSWNDLDLQPASEAAIFAPRVYAWWYLDPVIYLAAERGITVLPTIYGTPHWVATYQGCVSGCHKVGPRTVQAYIAFSLFMRAAVKRYGPGGDFWRQHPNLPARPIRTWQIWNEQNSSDYWKPEPNVDDYAGLVVAGGEAVHAVDPGASVILGGMIGEPAQAGKKTVSGWNFLARLYANPRVRAAFDGVAIHPYGKSMRQIKRTVWRWRQEMRRAGARRDRLWVTEIGWASGGMKHPLNRGPKEQAELVGESLRYFASKRGSLGIANVDYFAWRDAAPGADQCDWCAKSGLLKFRNRQPKPAWRAFRAVARGR